MPVRSISTTIVTPHVDACRQFHVAHFGAHVHFDCGWYVVLRFGAGEGAPELCFMEPRDGLAPTSGALVNLTVDDVDALHARCVAAGLPIVLPLEDHDWGDRGFSLLDPSGALLSPLVPIAPRGDFVNAYVASAAPASTELSALRAG
jgi:catechol 2,3-dioxygenase-like lactoylglutathione lyase family enzyme